MTTSESQLSSSILTLIRSKIKWADEWFKTLESVVHPVINEHRKGKKSVRIAILDTGVDTTHPQIRAALTKFKGFFPESPDSKPDSESDLFRDYHGHGTHGTSVLLRTAPNAAIYIARVTDKDGSLNYDDIVKVRLFITGLLLIRAGNKLGN